MTIQTVTADEAAEVAPGRKHRLIHTSSLMAVAWDFSGGPWPQPDPQHAHPHEQLTYVLSGELLFFIGAESRRLQAGDMVAVPSNQPHSIQLLSAEVSLLDAFTPLRQEFL